MFSCEVCGNEYHKKSNLKRHMTYHGDPKYKCTVCSKLYFRKDTFKKHEATHKNYRVFVTVKESFSINNGNKNESEKEEVSLHPIPPFQMSDIKNSDYDSDDFDQSSFELINIHLILPNENEKKDYFLFMNSSRDKVKNTLLHYLEEGICLKWYFEISAQFSKCDIEGVIAYFSPYFRSNIIKLEYDKLDTCIDQAFQVCFNSFVNLVVNQFCYYGYEWVLDSMLYFESVFMKYPQETLMNPSSNFCEVCQTEFSSAAALEEHMTTHNSNAFKCSYCGKFFDREENLKSHEYNHKLEPDMKENCDPSPSASENELIKKTGEIIKSISMPKYSHTNDSSSYNPLYSSQSSNQTISNKHQCNICQKTFSRRSGLSRHMKQHSTEKFKCSYCFSFFSRKDTLKKHEKRHLFTRKENLDHSKPNKISLENISMPKCLHKENSSNNPFLSSQSSDPNKTLENISLSQYLNSEDSSDTSSSQTIIKKQSDHSHLIAELEKDNLCEDITPSKDSEFKNISDTNSSTQGHRTDIHLILPKNDNNQNLSVFLEASLYELKDNLSQKLAKYLKVKWCLKLTIEFSKNDPNEIITFIFANFRTASITLIMERIDQSIDKAYQDILNSVEDFKIEESQRKNIEWNFQSILCLESKIFLTESNSSSETINYTYMPLPSEIILKRAVINVHNKDNKCFVWSVLAALHPPSSGVNRVTKYLPYESELDLTGLDFPLPLNQIERFEELNKISVNVFGYKKEVYPIFVTKKRFPRHVNLLLISNGEKEHYCYIKNMSRLLASYTTHQARRFYCNYCLRRFQLKKLYEKHKCDGFMYNFQSKRKKKNLF